MLRTAVAPPSQIGRASFPTRYQCSPGVRQEHGALRPDRRRGNEMNAAREELRVLVDEKCLTGRTLVHADHRASVRVLFRLQEGHAGREVPQPHRRRHSSRRLASCRASHKPSGDSRWGADFIVAAVIQRAFETGKPLVSGSIVRKAQKTHGTGTKIENELPESTPIMVVDDVVHHRFVDRGCLRRVHRGRIRHRGNRGPRGSGVRRPRDTGGEIRLPSGCDFQEARFPSHRSGYGRGS